MPFMHWLVTALRPALAVELGTHAGVSLGAICEATLRGRAPGRVYAVDTWRGDRHAGFYDEAVFTDLSAFAAGRYGAFAELLRLTFDEARPHFADGSIDLLHVDGLHTYEAVKADVEGWRPKMSPRGIVVLHDTNVRRDDFGVWRYWAELRAAHPGFEFLHGHGLGLVAVGAEVPEPMAALCGLDPARAAALRDRFAALGARWIATAEAGRAGTAASDLARDLAARTAETAALGQALTTASLAAARADGLDVARRQLEDEVRLRCKEIAALETEQRRLLEEARGREARIAALKAARAGLRDVLAAQGREGEALSGRLRRAEARLAEVTGLVLGLDADRGGLAAGLAGRSREVVRLEAENAEAADLAAGLFATIAELEADNVALRDAAAFGPSRRGFLGRPRPAEPPAIVEDAADDRAPAPGPAAFGPLVSVIVPNYDHGRFLGARIESILAQTYGRIELILLDDASSDDSPAIIARYAEAFPDLIRTVLNPVNGGSVFAQWRRGIAEARGALLWICESDDFADPRFLERLVPTFADESVMLAFGRIQFADEAGRPYEGLDAYREWAEAGIWGRPWRRPARAWFSGAFGVSNVIANVGGCLIRAQPIERAIWDEACRFAVLGDWYLYLRLARGGRIAYEPEAVSWFRQHGGNTSTRGVRQGAYYAEHERLLAQLRARWDVSETTVARFTLGLHLHFVRSRAAEALGPFASVFDPARTLAARRHDHILLVSLGFRLGGGEIFPIHLANALVARGLTVSLLALDDETDPDIRARLDRRVAVYGTRTVRDVGGRRFVESIGATLVHSHFVGAEGLFFGEGEDAPDLPYVVTLHGSYEVTPLSADFLATLVRRVSHWVALTPRNLEPLRRLEADARLPTSRLATSRLANAVPADPRPFPRDRPALGIGEEDVVFALVARAIPEKGWDIAIRARAMAQESCTARLVLLLCGAGPEADRLGAAHAGDPDVRFLGFQDRVQGLYRLADCALLPTRFPGESAPLALIEALQVGRPVIATDLGEIPAMLAAGGVEAGLAVPADDDDDAFARAVAAAMRRMAEPESREGWRRGAETLGRAYRMDEVVEAYLACYARAAARHGAEASAAPAR